MSKLIKAEVLMKEAKSDVEHGSYNKAVSASYFAVRLTVEHFLNKLRTTKDDKIANALFREVSKRLGKREAERMRKEYMLLFNERKKADHRPYLFMKDETTRLVQMAESLREEIITLLSDK